MTKEIKRPYIFEGLLLKIFNRFVRNKASYAAHVYIVLYFSKYDIQYISYLEKYKTIT
jgi:hypothetical protein